MIHLLSSAEIDKSRWDACISASPNGMVYAFSWFLDIVSPGWSGLVEDDYVSVFPLTSRKKFIFSYLYQPHFMQQGGLFSRKEISAVNVDQFLRSIPEEYKLVEIQLNTGNTFEALAPEFSFSPRLTHHLNLEPGYSVLQKGYSENLRRNLRKSEKAGNRMLSDFNPAVLIDLFRTHRGKDIETMNEAAYRVLQQLLAALAERHLLELVGVQSADNKLIAGAFFVKSLHEYIFLFSATTGEGRDSGAMSAVIDDFIRRHAGAPVKLDFEGSMDPNLARFYKSFGAGEIVYLQVRKNQLPAYIRWLKN